MKSNLRQHVTVMLAAALGVMIGSVGPGVAQAAYDAVNADKVDGKHAVGAGATVTQRKGKLVATSPTTGLLPNGIIAKAPDSAKVGGYPHSALRFLALPVQAVAVEGASTKYSVGITLSGSSDGGLQISFLVPPDHEIGNSLYMDVLFMESSADACAMYLVTGGLSGPIGDDFYNGGWTVPPSTSYDGPLAIPAGPLSGHTRTFRSPFPAEPGDLVSFRMSRNPFDAADTCGSIQVVGLQLRY